MKSDEYWRKREEAARKNRITDEKEMRRQIDAINQRMIDECNAQIDAWLQRYADKDGITLQEAKKRVSRLDIAEYERYARELVQRGSVMRRSGKKVSYGDFSDEENEQMRIYNLTMKINRLEMLKSRIGLQTTAGYAEMRNYLGDKLTDKAIAESERQAGILGESVNMNAEEASSIVNASFKGATFSQRLWKNQQELQSSLDRSLTSALIQGWGSAKVARQIRKNFAGDFKKAGQAAMRLAVTELARVEIGAQQESFKKMGFDQYTFLAVGPHPCDICQALDGKHFDVDKMQPGENAPPMHPWCHCSVAAYSDRSDYDEWLNSGAAADGVPLEEFSKKKDTRNYAKAVDSFFQSSRKGNEKYASQDIVDELSKSPVGQQTIRDIENNHVRILIRDNDFDEGARGYQEYDTITIFTANINNRRVAAQTVIHEMTHYKYHIGKCQHAEAICFAMEKMHLTKHDYLTKEEWEYVKNLAIQAYPEYNWEEGGYGNYEQFDFVKD